MNTSVTDPFRAVSLTIEYVAGAAGSYKTRTAITLALDDAKQRGVKTIFAMPTVDLADEMFNSHVAIQTYRFSRSRARTAKHDPVRSSMGSAPMCAERALGRKFIKP
jgi:hypothetical protein